MYRKLTPEQIVGLALYNFIVNEGYLEAILEKMHAINLLESVSYETRDNNNIEEIYTRELYLNGKQIGNLVKKYEYKEDEIPTLQLNIKENVTPEDLRDYLINADYDEMLEIAEEIQLAKKDEIKLILK